MSQSIESKGPLTKGASPPQAPLGVGAPPAGKSWLHVAVERDYEGLTKFLFFLCGKRGVRGANAEDAISKTFVIAFKREHGGNRWEPRKNAATLHLGSILMNEVLPNGRRALKRRREDPMGADGEPAGATTENAPAADERMLAEAEVEELASEVRHTLAAQTNEGLTLRILDAMREGVSGHENLANHLKVSVAKIGLAFRRMRRRVEKVYGEGGRGAAS